MSPASSGHCFRIQCLILFHFLITSGYSVVLEQTLPENEIVCPGQVLQYTCSSNENSVAWILGSDQHVFDEADDVNASMRLQDFDVLLTDKNGSLFVSTATNPAVSSVYDDMIIQCVGGTSSTLETIAITDGPANCSSTSVVPVCQATPSDTDGSKTDILVMLPTNVSLMCVVAYQIQFNGENRTIPVNSNTAEFSVSSVPGVQVLDGTIYTLDHENRIGQVPCTFNIDEPTGVKDIEFQLLCNATTHSVTVMLSWMPSEIRGCLDRNTPILYSLDFNDTLINSASTSDAYYELSNAQPGAILEVTIVPRVPVLGLSGSPMSKVVNTGMISCGNNVPQTTTTTTSPVTSRTGVPTFSQSVPATGVATGDDPASFFVITLAVLGVLIFLILILLVLAVFGFVAYIKTRKPKSDQEVLIGDTYFEGETTLPCHDKPLNKERTAKLQKFYEEDKKPEQDRIEQIAHSMHLHQNTVKQWFKQERFNERQLSVNESEIRRVSQMGQRLLRRQDSVPYLDEIVSEEAKAKLQECYKENKHPTREAMEEISTSLELHPSTVKQWFKQERLNDRSNNGDEKNFLHQMAKLSIRGQSRPNYHDVAPSEEVEVKLQEHYDLTKYPSIEEEEKIAFKLRLHPRTVKKWFKNKRYEEIFKLGDQENFLFQMGQECSHRFEDHLSEKMKLELRRYYDKDKYPSVEEMEQIALKLHLHPTAVKKWFKQERYEEMHKDRSSKDLASIDPVSPDTGQSVHLQLPPRLTRELTV